MNAPVVTIRPLTPGDAAFLPEIVYYAVHVPPGAEPPPREIVNDPGVAKYVREWGRPGDFGLVTVDADATRIGAAWMRLFTAADLGYGYIADDIPEISIALLPGYRRMGIGTELIRGLIGHATGKYPALSLAVVDTNPAIRLYGRCGFAEVSRTGNSITMRRDLG